MKTMDNKHQLISTWRIANIRAQGYDHYSDQEISALSFGNRFAYIVCTILLLTGLITRNIPLLSAVLVIAFSGVVLPYHPFDYVYNYAIKRVLDKPLLPRRSNQLKFACLMATAFILLTLYFLLTGRVSYGYLSGCMLVSVALLVSTTDYCIPSTIYNRIFSKH
jgi:hypothetical protein